MKLLCKLYQNQKKYVINEIKKICDDIKSNKVKCDGRFYKGYNIIQILSCNNPNITKDKVIFDICNNFGVSRNECYLLQEKPNNIGFETRIEKLQEEKNYYFTQKQIDLFESKQVINESSRDNLLLPYLELVQKIEPNITLGQLKNYLMKKFVTEGNIHALSLGSNFYLSGVARYYFNGDLTTNKKNEQQNGNEFIVKQPSATLTHSFETSMEKAAKKLCFIMGYGYVVYNPFAAEIPARYPVENAVCRL